MVMPEFPARDSDSVMSNEVSRDPPLGSQEFRPLSRDSHVESSSSWASVAAGLALPRTVSGEMVLLHLQFGTLPLSSDTTDLWYGDHRRIWLYKSSDSCRAIGDDTSG